MQYYSEQFCIGKVGYSRACLSYEEFVNKCQDLEKMTVSDVFALQLMQVIYSSFSLKLYAHWVPLAISSCFVVFQVPQVTEDIALAVVGLYPTVLSLAQAYFQLVSTLPCCCLDPLLTRILPMIDNANAPCLQTSIKYKQLSCFSLVLFNLYFCFLKDESIQILNRLIV